MSRAFAVAVAAVLMAAASLFGAAGPASAVVVKNTEVRFDPSTSTSTGYGDYYSLYAYAYEAGTNTKVYRGGLTLNTRPIGGTTWTPLVSNTSAYVIEGIELSESFEYQAVYAGSKATTSTGTTYNPSVSPVFTVTVNRGIKYIEKGPRKICAQVGPLSAPYKNKPVTTSYKIGKKKGWRNSWTFRTNKKSMHCYKITKTKAPKNVKVPKGPKLRASKTVFVKSGGMKKYVDIQYYTY
ncbi:hypothetical protein ACJ5H2_20165 [Nocardioides sp. R1-1]|uniref:hypothetical protein n=1 Tax=Nocardioides sp. R1-1 TaxID=3383502 RepID=UPI0038D0655F